MIAAGDALRRGLCANIPGPAFVETLESRSWASITFSGERHRIVLRLAGENAGAAADGFLDGLCEREFALDGHILADIGLVSEQRDGDWVRLTLEALTVEEN